MGGPATILPKQTAAPIIIPTRTSRQLRVVIPPPSLPPLAPEHGDEVAGRPCESRDVYTSQESTDCSTR